MPHDSANRTTPPQMISVDVNLLANPRIIIASKNFIVAKKNKIPRTTEIIGNKNIPLSDIAK